MERLGEGSWSLEGEAAGGTPTPGSREEEETRPRELCCLGEVTPTEMRVVSQSLWKGARARGACGLSMAADAAPFRPQSHHSLPEKLCTVPLLGVLCAVPGAGTFAGLILLSYTTSEAFNTREASMS